MPYTPKIAKNSASGILITDSTSTITVDVSGYTLPTSISSGQFNISIESEILLVTGVTDNTTYYTLDVTRAQESTVQVIHTTGNTVELKMTAGLYNELASQVSTNTTKLDLIDVTGASAIDLNTLYSDTTANNAKVSNITHTGDVTGSSALTIDPTAISGKTGVTPAAGDYVLLWDASDSLLKKADVTTFISDGSGGGAVDSVNGFTGAVTLVTGDISDSTSTQKYTTAGDITKLGYISVTQAVNLDTLESDTTTNNAKVSNATHTGDVIGSTSLTIDPSAISGKTGVTPVAGDYVLLWDATDSLLKKADVTTFLSGGSGDVTGPASSTNTGIAIYNGTGGKTLMNSLVTIDTSSVAIPGFLTVTGQARHSSQATLTSSGTVTWNINNDPKAKLIITGDVTSFTISGINLNSEATLYLVQDTSSAKTVTWPGDIIWAGDTEPDLSTLSSRHIISFYSYDGTGLYGSHVSDDIISIDSIDSVNGQTGTVVLVTGDISDSTSTQKYTTAGDITKLSYISVTQAVDLDTMESNITTNNAKTSNATHTGEVTGATSLTIDPTAISGKTGVTPVSGDYVLLWDATDSALKKADVSTFLGGDVTGPASALDRNIAIFDGTGGKLLIDTGVNIDALNNISGANSLVVAEYVQIGEVTSLVEASITMVTDSSGIKKVIYFMDGNDVSWVLGEESDVNFQLDRYSSGVYVDTPFLINAISGDMTTTGLINGVDITALVSNATHTGDVTGSGALTIDPTAISGKTGVTPVAGDYVLLWDATDSLLKKADVTNFISAITASSTTTFTNKRMTKRVQAITDATGLVFDCDSYDSGYVTLTASRTLNNFTGTPTNHQTAMIEFIQGGSGSYTVTMDTTGANAFRLGADVTGLVLSTAVGNNDLALFVYSSDSTAWLLSSISKGY